MQRHFSERGGEAAPWKKWYLNYELQDGHTSKHKTEKAMKLKYKAILTLFSKDLREKKPSACWVFCLGALQHRVGSKSAEEGPVLRTRQEDEA